MTKTKQRPAAHQTIHKDLTAVGAGSYFARCITHLFTRVHPRLILETGTYHGLGTTYAIARALRDLEIDNARFYSIEVNPKNHAKAVANLHKAGLRVDVLNGLSIPRSLLPTKAQIEEQYVHAAPTDGVYVDHTPADRTRLYHEETDFPNLPDDLLGQCLGEFDFAPDFVLLDSAGHMGFIEFEYLIAKLRGPCHLALDDVHHVKHYRSFEVVRNDPRFELLTVSEEKFGFCIARFTPGW